VSDDRPERLLYPMTEAAEKLGIHRTSLYALMARGELLSCSIGRRRLIPESEIIRFVARRMKAGRDRADAGAC
jgi:excisionase family DNA binding protein